MSAALTWPDLTARPRAACDMTLSYGTDALQVVDLWRPAGTGPHPVVLMVHGGCWQTSIADRRLMDWIAADLRGSGVAVWNIDYRGVDRSGGGYPGTISDNGCGVDVVASLVGDRPNRFADTSIPPLLPLGIPQTLVNGREDAIVPYRFATDYVARAQAAGDAVRLVTVPDTGHVALITPDTPAWATARTVILDAFKGSS